nr:uncharacterized protein LOC103433100 [Malus domestica]
MGIPPLKRSVCLGFPLNVAKRKIILSCCLLASLLLKVEKYLRRQSIGVESVDLKPKRFDEELRKRPRHQPVQKLLIGLIADSTTNEHYNFQLDVERVADFRGLRDFVVAAPLCVYLDLGFFAFRWFRHL